MPTLEEEISRRRTFAIISHPDAGKTTLTEKFLLYGGAIAQAGEVKGKRAKAATCLLYTSFFSYLADTPDIVQIGPAHRAAFQDTRHDFAVAVPTCRRGREVAQFRVELRPHFQACNDFACDFEVKRVNADAPAFLVYLPADGKQFQPLPRLSLIHISAFRFPGAYLR